MHVGPLLLLILVVVGIESAFCSTPGAGDTHFDGHVLCRIGNGKADVPVRNAEVKLMEGDLCWLGWFDCDDLLASAITEAEGAFSLDGHELEGNDEIEPYLLIKACRKADDESSCNVKKIIEPERGLIVKNYNYFMDDEFCQHCQGGGECKSA